MEKRFLFLSLTCILMGLIFVGCNKRPAEYQFSYSMESVDNYKIVVTFNSDKTYKIEEFNYFLDNQANIRAPKIKDGNLTDEEYELASDKIFNANLFNMDDTYGFDNEDRSTLGDIIYQFYLTRDGEEKYISIANGSNQKFSSSFLELIDFINDFIRTNKVR